MVNQHNNEIDETNETDTIDELLVSKSNLINKQKLGGKTNNAKQRQKAK